MTIKKLIDETLERYGIIVDIDCSSFDDENDIEILANINDLDADEIRSQLKEMTENKELKEFKFYINKNFTHVYTNMNIDFKTLINDYFFITEFDKIEKIK